MLNTGKLAGRTAFITGASRGIGKAIAEKLAKDGANIVIAAKTVTPHPKLPGTIYTAAEELEKAGAKCLPCIVDVRDEAQIQEAVDNTVKKFGGIDILINNASAISLTGTLDTPMKKYDLMNGVNARGTYLVSRICLPYLKVAKNPHILNISPPLNMNAKWFRNHVAYTMAKYGMSMCVLGMAGEFHDDNIAVNALWPKTAIWTAAMGMLGGPDTAAQCRKVDIMADAAYVMLTRDSKSYTGNFAIDEDVLREVGIKEFDHYAEVPGSSNLMPDFFLDDVDPAAQAAAREAVLQKPAAAEAPAASQSEVAAIFNKLKGFINDEVIGRTKAVYLFEIKGKETEYWLLDLKNGAGSVAQGSKADKADVTFVLKAADCVKMFAGGLKPTTAFMMGKLKIKGDMPKAMKLEKLLSSLKSRL